MNNVLIFTSKATKTLSTSLSVGAVSLTLISIAWTNFSKWSHDSWRFHRVVSEGITYFLLSIIALCLFTSVLLLFMPGRVELRGILKLLLVSALVFVISWVLLNLNSSAVVDYGLSDEPLDSIPVVSITPDEEGGVDSSGSPSQQSPAVLAALQELEEYSFMEGDISWENAYGTGETFGPYMFRVGDEIYSRYNDEDSPERMVSNIDLETFRPNEVLTEQYLYGPVIDGGYRPHYYEDENYFYCGVGAKGSPNVVRIPQPVTLVVNNFPGIFDASDGFSDLERSAWRSLETKKTHLLYLLQSETNTYYNVSGCEAVELPFESSRNVR